MVRTTWEFKILIGIFEYCNMALLYCITILSCILVTRHEHALRSFPDQPHYYELNTSVFSFQVFTFCSISQQR
jgi:hypothetical protein